MDDVIAFCLYLTKKVRLTLRRLLRRKCYRDFPERNECNQSLLHYSQLPEFILVFVFFLYFLNLSESYKTIPLIFTRNIKTNRQTDRQTESENVRCYPRWRHASLYDVIIMDELTINKQVASLFKKHLLFLLFENVIFFLMFALLLFQWNLICEKANIAATVQSLFVGGMMAGSLVFGAVSDFFGRRFCLFLCSALAVGLSITLLESIYTDI